MAMVFLARKLVDMVDNSQFKMTQANHKLPKCEMPIAREEYILNSLPL